MCRGSGEQNPTWRCVRRQVAPQEPGTEKQEKRLMAWTNGRDAGSGFIN